MKYVHEYSLFSHSKLMLLVMTFSALSVIFLIGQLLYPSGLVDNPKFIKTSANLRMLATQRCP